MAKCKKWLTIPIFLESLNIDLIPIFTLISRSELACIKQGINNESNQITLQNWSQFVVIHCPVAWRLQQYTETQMLVQMIIKLKKKTFPNSSKLKKALVLILELRVMAYTIYIWISQTLFCEN